MGASLDTVIDAIDKESSVDSANGQISSLRNKFWNWKKELAEIQQRGGTGEGSTVMIPDRDMYSGRNASAKGGLFSD